MPGLNEVESQIRRPGPRLVWSFPLISTPGVVLINGLLKSSPAAIISRSWHLVRADVICDYLKPGSFDVFELESALGVSVSP
jgi:hypothetical protein